MRVLPNHGTGIPALSFGGHQTSRKGSGVDEAVGCVRSSSRLSDDELFQGNACRGVNLEERGLGPSRRGICQEAIAGGVLILALVVELEVVPTSGKRVSMDGGWLEGKY